MHKIIYKCKKSNLYDYDTLFVSYSPYKSKEDFLGSVGEFLEFICFATPENLHLHRCSIKK